MGSDDERRNYVERVRENTRSYIEEVLRENARLRGRADEIGEEQRALERQLDEARQELTHLATLYAASYQLGASLRRDEVLATIQEIVVNLVGSEELVILSLEDGGEMVPVASVGVDPARITRLGRTGLIEAAERRREPVTAGPGGPGEDGVTACIPLVVAGRTLALVAIFRLLPQKPALGPLDVELFGLLAQQAATALYCAELHEHHGDES